MKHHGGEMTSILTAKTRGKIERKTAVTTTKVDRGMESRTGEIINTRTEVVEEAGRGTRAAGASDARGETIETTKAIVATSTAGPGKIETADGRDRGRRTNESDNGETVQ